MTTDFPFDIIGFDLDGTLVDTSGDLAAAVNHALGLAGRPPLGVEAVTPMIGLGAKHMLEQGLAATGGVDAADFKPLYRALLGFYEANIAVHSHLFAGAADLLDALDAHGERYGVVTNKFEGLAVKLLGELGVLDRMACVIGADTLGIENAKPSGAPVIEMMRRAGRTRAAFIGDSIYDVMAAANAGVTSVAVRFGFLHQAVETLGADHIIDHFDELLPLLGSIKPGLNT
jgi:phosphoglycolate phosphatase